MENVIKRLIEIDKKALEIKNKANKLDEENEKRLNERLKAIEEKELSKAEKVAKKKYDDLVKEGQSEAQRIEEEGEKMCWGLENKYNKIHHRLEKEIFDEIINL